MSDNRRRRKPHHPATTLTRKTAGYLARAALTLAGPDVYAAASTLKTHRYTFGHLPNVLAPRTFNDKIQARKLFDRNPVFTTWVDKLACRAWVSARSDILQPRLLHVTTDPRTIPFDTLPPRIVIKASHGSGWVRIVANNARLDRGALIAECNGWLATNYADLHREEIYRTVPPGILVEECLTQPDGRIPSDYKLYVFGGQVRMVQVDVDRYGTHRRALFDQRWNRLRAQLTVQDYVGDVARPATLERMIAEAERLSEGIDFVRVDLYTVGGAVYFGEMTPTSGNGLNRFTPAPFDATLGQFWRVRVREPVRIARVASRVVRDLAGVPRLPVLS